jgi:K+-sensing histidine kinase KdpD
VRKQSSKDFSLVPAVARSAYCAEVEIDMNADESRFAPSERAKAEEIDRDARVLSGDALLCHVTHVLPHILMVLNEQRQIVYKNEKLMNLAAASSAGEPLGKRPGELLNCIHANEEPGGCGTTEFCRECGAVKSILLSQREKVGVEEECRITTTSGAAYEFRVWATPYAFQGAEYTLFSLLDIANEKRRAVLERIFFHDINNILCVIEGHSEIAALDPMGETVGDSLKTIQYAAKELAAEIESQRQLLKAESGQLHIRIAHDVSALELLHDLMHMASRKWPSRASIQLLSSDNASLATDRVLLFRVLFNMLRNAVEASESSEIVSLQCLEIGASAVFSVHNCAAMPRSVQLQIFQRSFSTKGNGRGIGTYSMKLLGEKFLRGKVWFSSSEAKGTTFFVSIPKQQENR